VAELWLVRPLEPNKRKQFMKYACRITMNPKTANSEVILSNGNRHATVGKKIQYDNNTEKFDSLPQVLCREGLSGRCYWEVQWSGDDGVEIAVAYKGISRKGEDNNACLGYNEKSWSLYCSHSMYTFRHNSETTSVCGPSSSTIGVYLDHRAGTLSFYSVSKDSMTLLHRVQTTFTEPLYPGFSIYSHKVSETYYNRDTVKGSTVQLQILQ
ncbi:stonustoxin subunit beta-like, partial [Scleropages formosus]|uniref:stonustoxin subunit beta-like n=1 Tax=Scleropages formosus TaxID=113540 RepID=UPI0010FAC0A7